MKVTLSYLAIASAISVASAASCTSDNAAPWPYTPDNGGGGGGDGDCNGDPTCLALEAEGQCNALSLLDEEDTICVKARRLSRKHKRAVDLDCTGNERCLFFTDNSLLCLDASSGEYHDDVGGSGNAISGVYTAPNGEVQTVTGTAADDTADPTATPTARASSSGDDGDSTAASTMATRTAQSGSQTTATPAAAASGSGSGSGSASQTSSAAGATNAAMLAAAAMPLLVAIL